MANYRHEWDLGEMTSRVTAANAMSILQSDPNSIFPFTVKSRSGISFIRMGEIYDLINTIGPFKNWGTGADPVQVTAVTSTSFTFTTLAGHHRGPGQTITFETLERLELEDDGVTMRMHVFLVQRGTYVSSLRHPFTSAFNLGANVGAAGAWALQAHNLRAALGTEGSVEHAIIPGQRTVWPSP
jgi:hypothetical protein